MKNQRKISNHIKISPQVKEAIEKGKPVIAMESSVIAQGLPHPVNIKTALKLEEIAEDAGVTPATIALIDGKIKVGLTKKEIEKLAEDPSVFKVSKRDIAPVLAKKGSGGTTVAATVFIASIAGIKIFATGGIGGVHKGKPFDISADLGEMARNRTAVISAGPKSIIDLPLTLEYLETAGVSVAGYKTDYCPHFFVDSKKYKLTIKADTPDELARIIKINEDLENSAGILILNPLAKEDCLHSEDYNNAYKKANEEAREKNITGNRLTPFLLERINYLTEGKSQKANLTLLENNVRLASLISISYTILTKASKA